MEQPTVEVKIAVDDDTVVYGIGHNLDEAWDNAYREMTEWIARQQSTIELT